MIIVMCFCCGRGVCFSKNLFSGTAICMVYACGGLSDLLIHSRSGHAWVVVIGCCMVWAQMTKYGHVRAGDMGRGDEDKY